MVEGLTCFRLDISQFNQNKWGSGVESGLFMFDQGPEQPMTNK